MSDPDAALASAIEQKNAKRDEEQKRILQLKQRLEALKKDSSNDRCTKEELQELHKKCESILSLTRRIADSIDEKINADRKELQQLKQETESNRAALNDVQKLKKEVDVLQQSNDELKAHNDPEESRVWKEKYEAEKKRADSAQAELQQLKKGGLKISQDTDSLRDSQESISENQPEVCLFVPLPCFSY